MSINRENYELYFLDYFDGNLAGELKQELFAFLQQHPDLKAEFEAFDDVRLQAPEVKMSGKEALKKIPVVATGALNETNYEDYLIASAEGDLSAKEAQHLDAFLKNNPHLKKEAAIYQQTRLHPDKEITFTQKQELKKKPLLVHLRRGAYWYGIAASIALLLAIFVPNNKIPQNSSPVDRMLSLNSDPIKFRSAAPTPELRSSQPLSTGVQPASLREAFNVLPQMASLQAGKLPEASNNLKMHKRMEMISLYYYDQLEEDLEYYAMIQEYNQKTLLERMAYQVKNRVAGNNDMYITDPGLSKLNLSAETLTALNDFSLTDVLPERKPDKSKKKDYHFKSDLIEILRSRGE